MLQDRVLVDVPPAAAPPARLATHPFAAEAALLITADAARVVGRHVEPHPMEAQRSEPVVQQHTDGFRAIALDLKVLLADQDPERPRPVRQRRPAQRAIADQPLSFPEGDAERVLFLALVQRFQPTPLLDSAHGLKPSDELKVFGLVHPGLVERRILDLDGPEVDPLADPECVLHGHLRQYLAAGRLPKKRKNPAAGHKKPNKKAPTPAGLGAFRSSFRSYVTREPPPKPWRSAPETV